MFQVPVTGVAIANGKTSLVYAKADDGTNPNIASVALASDLVDDTSPQLGGNLDTNSFMIDFDDLITVLEMRMEMNN